MERIDIPTAGTPDERASRLAAQLTIEEKAQQLVGIMPMGLIGPHGLVEAAVEQALGGGIGQVSGIGMFGSQSAPQVAASVNALQRYLLENTRAGIPAIFHNEALNGVVAPDFTLVPDRDRAGGDLEPGRRRGDGRAHPPADAHGRPHSGALPVLDVARDARWGRVHETYGEDPYLASAFGVAFIRGLQGDRPLRRRDRHRQALPRLRRHRGGPEHGRQPRSRAASCARCTPARSRRRSAIAGLASVMNSYSTIDGVRSRHPPRSCAASCATSSASTGSVVSDYMTTQMLVERNEVAEDKVAAAALALSAGLDVELPNPYAYGPVLAGAVRDGRIAESQLDEAVHRALRDKFALGLFEHPYASEDPIEISEVAGRGGSLAALARRPVGHASEERRRRAAARSVDASHRGARPARRVGVHELRRVHAAGRDRAHEGHDVRRHGEHGRRGRADRHPRGCRHRGGRVDGGVHVDRPRAGRARRLRCPVAHRRAARRAARRRGDVRRHPAPR